MKKVLEGFDFKAPKYTFNNKDYSQMANALGIKTLDRNQQLNLQRACSLYLYLEASWKIAGRTKDVRKLLKGVHVDVVRLMKTLHSLHDINAEGKPARQSALQLLLAWAPKNHWSKSYQEEMVEYSEKLIELVRKPESPAQQSELEMLLASPPENGWSEQYSDEMFAFTRRLVELGRAAKSALEEVPASKGGRLDNLPLNTLCKTLMELFVEITKRDPTISTDAYCESIEEEFKGKCIDFVEAFLKPLPELYHKTPRELGLVLKRIIREHARPRN
jgi:hypothetical protein